VPGARAGSSRRRRPVCSAPRRAGQRQIARSVAAPIAAPFNQHRRQSGGYGAPGTDLPLARAATLAGRVLSRCGSSGTPIEEHKADPERAAAQSTFTNSLKLLRQARERLGQGLRAAEAGNIAESDEISLRNQ